MAGVVDGVDQSWGELPPNSPAAAAIKVVSGYLSHDPSKNWTAARIRAYHAAGKGVIFNWESTAGRPLLGRQAGIDDATEFLRQAERLIAEVGYAPSYPLAAYFSCDRDVTAANWPAIDAYYAGTRAVLAAHDGHKFWNAVYGQFDVIEHLHAAGLTDSEWQTLAWSRGLISSEADFYQSAIDQTLGGASVDFDQIRHVQTLGAWWPPEQGASGMARTLSSEDLDAIFDRIFKTDGVFRGPRVLNASGTSTGEPTNPANPFLSLLSIVGFLQDWTLHANAEVSAQRQYVKDVACAIGGQRAALPDGTKITSIGAALITLKAHVDTRHAELLAHIDRLAAAVEHLATAPAVPVDLAAIAAAVTAAAKAGAASAIEGSTVTGTLHGGRA